MGNKSKLFELRTFLNHSPTLLWSRIHLAVQKVQRVSDDNINKRNSWIVHDDKKFEFLLSDCESEENFGQQLRQNFTLLKILKHFNDLFGKIKGKINQLDQSVKVF